MTTTFGRYKERRVNGLIWDRYLVGVGNCQTESTYTPREESRNGHCAHVRENGERMITILSFPEGTLFPTLNFRRPDGKRFSQATPPKSLRLHRIYHLQQKIFGENVMCASLPSISRRKAHQGKIAVVVFFHIPSVPPRLPACHPFSNRLSGTPTILKLSVMPIIITPPSVFANAAMIRASSLADGIFSFISREDVSSYL